jgi:HPt (histidine-containing phosphotransfer) domain-containing protein
LRGTSPNPGEDSAATWPVTDDASYATTYTFIGSARAGNDPELINEIVQLLLEEGPKYMAGIHDGLAAGDAKLVHRSAHTIKGSLSHSCST